MTGKQKGIVLLLREKAKILKRLKNSKVGTTLALEYDIGKSTISEIKKERNYKFCIGI